MLDARPLQSSAPLRRRFRGSILHRLLRNPVGLQGTVLIGVMCLIALLAPVLAPYSAEAQHGDALLQGPSADYWLGTDNLGRDQFSRLLHGTRLAWLAGLSAVGIGATVGVVAGLVAGYYRGIADELVMRVADVIFAFPGLVFLILLVGVLGPSLRNALIAIGIGMAPAFARMTRGQVLSVKETEYVAAARSLGSSDVRIMFRYILPNIAATLIVQTSLAFSSAILIESSLSFLGLGAQPPAPSWGSMLNLSRQYMEIAPWLAIFPGLAVMLSVLGFNQLGDGLRDVLDPRLRGRL